MTTPIRINDNEWQTVRQAAKTAYVNEVLGERPTRKSVASKRHDAPVITMVQFWGIITLIALFVVTSFKVGFVTVPFSIGLAHELMAEYALDAWIEHVFIASSIILSILMATPALILFKLYAEDDYTLRKQKETRGYTGWRRVSIEYISPRLSSTLVYLTMAWLFFTASWGIEGISDAFLRYIPVIMELGLARLVGDIMAGQIHFRQVVTEAVEQAEREYDEKLDKYEYDERYSLMLFQRLRDAVIHIYRVDEKRKRTQPNLWLMQANGEQVNAFIKAEYQRLTGGSEFAAYVKQLRAERELGVEQPVQAAAATGRRRPPNGDKRWTEASLTRDFEIRGLSREAIYTEATLANDYEEKYNARGAWRAGARNYFTA